MGNFKKLSLLGFLLLLALPSLAQKSSKKIPQELPLQAQAQELYYDRQNQILTLLGEVKIEKPPWTIYAEEMKIDLKTNLIRAEKGVKVVKKEKNQEKEIILADSAEINLETDSGYLVQGKMILPTNQGEITITGDQIEKLSESLYLFKNGSFTSCQCPEGKKPDWSVSAKEIKADTETTAQMHSARVLIRGKKLFSLPYYELPISDQRKSGFLPPELGYTSRGGAQARLPYFQTLGPSADFTFYPTYIEKRGFQTGGEFNYNLGPFSTARLEGFIIEDQKEDLLRWSVFYFGESSWQSGWLKEDLKLLSDNEYVLDFQQELANRWQRELSSSLVLSQNLPFSNLSAELKWSNDLGGWDLKPISGWREDQDEEVIQQLPKISFQLFQKPILGPLGFDLNSSFINYWRQDQELGRGIQASLSPRLSFAPKLGPGFGFSSFAGYKFSALSPYDSDFNPSEFLARPLAGANFGLGLERIYEQKQKTVVKYRHLLEPEFLIFYQGSVDQPEAPFFQKIIDPEERGIMGLRLTSLLFQKKPEKRDSSAQLVSEFELNQFYDWTEQEFLDLEFKGFLESPKLLGMETNLFYDPESGDWHRARATLWLQDQRGDRFWIGYLYSKAPPKSWWYRSWDQGLEEYYPLALAEPDASALALADAENWLGGASVKMSNNLGIIYRINYSLLYDTLDSQSLLFNYLAPQKCWLVSLRISENINPYHPQREPHYSASLNFQLLTGTKLQLTPEWSSPELFPNQH